MSKSFKKAVLGLISVLVLMASVSTASAIDLENYDNSSSMSVDNKSISLEEGALTGYVDYSIEQKGNLSIKSRHLDNTLVQVKFLNSTTLPGNYTVKKIVHTVELRSENKTINLTEIPSFDQVRISMERNSVMDLSPKVRSLDIRVKRRTREEGVIEMILSFLTSLNPF